MKKDNLNKIIREHINEKSLSSNQVNALLSLQKKEIIKPNKFFYSTNIWIGTAAAFILVISNVLYLSFSPDVAMDQRIGNEVAKNHIELKPLEIQTTSIQEVRKFLTKLNFLPIESELLKGSSKTLIGARYCSIQGVTAAQLRLQDSKTGEVQSLYQTIYEPRVFSGLPELKENQKPVTIYSKGFSVDIWVEKGLLFALTK